MPENDPRVRRAVFNLLLSPMILNSGPPAGTKSPSAGTSSQDAVPVAGGGDQLFVSHGGQHTRTCGPATPADRCARPAPVRDPGRPCRAAGGCPHRRVRRALRCAALARRDARTSPGRRCWRGRARTSRVPPPRAPVRATRISQLDLADRQQRVDERRDEQPDGELAGPITQQPLHDARRELAHCELNDDEDDGEDQRRQTDHRRGNRSQDRQRCVRATRPDPGGTSW